VKFVSVAFLIGEAFRNIRRNGLMSLAALGTVMVALAVLGGSLWTAFRLNEYASSQPEKFNRIDVFVTVKTARGRVEEMQASLRRMPRVKEVKLVPKERAWAMLQLQEPTLAEAISDNPLPDKFEIETDNPEEIADLAGRLRNVKRFPEIEKVVDAGEEVRTLVTFARVIRVIGGGVAMGLFVATLFIIYNTIRLTVFARRREIRIMQLVGATAWFIRVPLLLEGALYGAVGGVLAGILLLFAGKQISEFVSSLHSPLVGDIPSAATPALVLLCLIALGIGLGLIGSYLAARRFLKQI
jgi:cell division transport system permease protein